MGSIAILRNDENASGRVATEKKLKVLGERFAHYEFYVAICSFQGS